MAIDQEGVGTNAPLPPVEPQVSIVSPEQQTNQLAEQMRGIFDRMDVINTESGGKFARILGKNEAKAAIPMVPVADTVRFDKSGEHPPREEPATDYIVATADGFKVIQVLDNYQYLASGKSLKEIMDGIITKGHPDTTMGLIDGVLYLPISPDIPNVSFRIDSQTLKTKLGEQTQEIPGAWIIDAEPEQVTKIMQVNKEKIDQQIAEEKQKGMAEQQRLANNLAAAQKVNELLG